MEESALAANLRERLAVAGLHLVCPRCKGPLDERNTDFSCAPCGCAFPVMEGIPDFRLAPDRFISLEDDRRKGLRALELAAGRGFEATLQAYWSITPELAPALAASHHAHQLIETEIGAQTLREIERLRTAASRRERVPETLLDLGCGTGGLLAAARGFRLAVGIDVAFRWLLIGRLRLQEAGLDPPLICANAESLPFPDESLDLVTANDLVEHVADPATVFQECRRVMAPQAHCYLSTNNRYSIAPEPHVHLWGVGWLPRGFQGEYVQAARGHSYQNVRMLSGGQLKRLARAAGLRCRVVEAAPLFARHLGDNLERLVNGYNAMRKWPVAAAISARIGPRLQIFCDQDP